MEKKDLAKHWGKSYVMEAVRYQGTPPMITALANGELDIANLAYSTLADRDPERRPRRPARASPTSSSDGVPGHFTQPVLRAARTPDQEDRGP